MKHVRDLTPRQLRMNYVNCGVLFDDIGRIDAIYSSIEQAKGVKFFNGNNAGRIDAFGFTQREVN